MKREQYLMSRNGLFRLHTVHWIPEDGAPRALLQLVHGVAEYTNRYDEFARFLNRNGIAVLGFDLPGHGKSVLNPSEYGFFAEEKGWELVCRTLRDVCQMNRLQFPGLPFFLFGHSMGSFLVRTVMIDFPEIADGFILSGTGQPNQNLLAAGERITALAINLLGVKGRSPRIERLTLGAYNQQFSPARTQNDWISRDKVVVDRFTADPLCQHMPTVSLFRDMVDGLNYIGREENLAKMDKHKPVYLFAGAEDPVGENGAKVRQVFYALLEAGCHHVSYKIYPGGRHEMLNELNRDEVFEDVLAWLKRRIEEVSRS